MCISMEMIKQILTELDCEDYEPEPERVEEFYKNIYDKYGSFEDEDTEEKGQ